MVIWCFNWSYQPRIEVADNIRGLILLECLSLAICIQEMCKIMLGTLSVNWQKLDPILVRS